MQTANDEAIQSAEPRGGKRKASALATERERRTVRAVRYDETRRRGKKRKTEKRVVYLERGNGPGRRGSKRCAIVVGTAVMERVVKGRYEWRHGGV